MARSGWNMRLLQLLLSGLTMTSWEALTACSVNIRVRTPSEEIDAIPHGCGQLCTYRLLPSRIMLTLTTAKRPGMPAYGEECVCLAGGVALNCVSQRQAVECNVGFKRLMDTTCRRRCRRCPRSSICCILSTFK
jgi:hypothetical protein